MSIPVEDIRFGYIMVPLFHKHHFNNILDLFHRRSGVSAELIFQHKIYNVRDTLRRTLIRQAVSFHSFIDSLSDFILYKISDNSIPFFDP